MGGYSTDVGRRPATATSLKEVIMGFALSDMRLTSAAFETGGAIPRKHTGEGDDIAPPLSWSGAPDNARSFAVICHDPDAPLVTPGQYGFVHWVLYNIPAPVSSLAEGSTEHTSGRNDFGKPGYGGPMPPEGHGTHHYFFWLLALDKVTSFQPGLTLWQLLERAEPNVVAMNRLVGTYQRG
jgi:Raf kinase inhibitor-like YbhB/YbcL family protein